MTNLALRIASQPSFGGPPGRRVPAVRIDAAPSEDIAATCSMMPEAPTTLGSRNRKGSLKYPLGRLACYRAQCRKIWCVLELRRYFASTNDNVIWVEDAKGNIAPMRVEFLRVILNRTGFRCG
jgi:hypothetical protein